MRALILAVACSACATLPTAPPDRDVVSTQSGLVRGHLDGAIRSFRGIPYAAPPVGELRWRAPRPPQPWPEVRDALGYGYICMQSTPADPEGTPIGSEDCLTLNVWAPVDHQGPLPVLVFIHGGWFVWGSSSMRAQGFDQYDGAWIASHGPAVVVTMNYRLGPLGFLAHPALLAEGEGSNFGLQDQIAALKWVQTNIAAFGGDPTHVLLFGHSAGASSTAALLASPKAKGLFSAALLHSGSPHVHSRAEAEAAGVRLAAALECGGRKTPGCLRARSASAVIAAGPEQFDAGGYGWGPMVDGVVLPRTPWESFARGEHNRVPLVVGTTANEFSTMIYHYLPKPIDAAEYQAELERRYSQRASEVLQQYPASAYETPNEAFIAMLNDRGLVCPSQWMAGALAKQKEPRVWRFVYDHTFDSGPLAKFGAGHGMDVRLLFHTSPPKQLTLSEREETASSAMIRYWVRFAATGDPNGGDDPIWPSYDQGGEVLVLGPELAVKPEPRREACVFWTRPKSTARR